MIVVALVLALAMFAISFRFIRENQVTDPSPLATTNELSVWQTRFTTERQINDPDATFQGDDSFTDYIGAQACRRCHTKQYESYSQTLHSESYKETHASGEPAGGKFHHAASSRRYEIYHDDDKLRHRERWVDAAGKTIAVTDIAMKYTVGSGEHGCSYLYESEGFFFQSPLTWYREIDGWKMSPGYEHAGHSSFTRVVNEDCLYCHVGMIERAADNYAKFRVVEQKIGCERCHGPGRSHVEIYEKAERGSVLEENVDDSSSTAGSETVDSIVHPGKLSRERSEAICQQCHLQGTVFVTAPETSLWDFRPGQSMLEVRSDYQVAGQDESKIVGHVEQLHQSKCYLRSDTLTCITCHDPHHNVPKQGRVEYNRDACLACHSDEACGVSHSDRQRDNGNDCAACHMPKLATNVSHAALHHHRIGIHETKDRIPPDPQDQSPLRLVSILNDQSLDAQERTRREWLALGKHDFWEGIDPRLGAQHREATRKFFASFDAETMDPESKLMLADEAVKAGEIDFANTLAAGLIDTTRPGSDFAINAHSILATNAYHAGRRDLALKHYRELGRSRINSTDLVFLALCELDAGNIDEAVRALEKSLLLAPDNLSAHEVISDIFDVAQRDRAAEHRRVIQALKTISLE